MPKFTYTLDDKKRKDSPTITVVADDVEEADNKAVKYFPKGTRITDK